ncbi:hypothetical protein DEFDS_0794 [Deferribacter desulfuricans SSM1]|uniref:Uncharacterized protein n=1 Tax=Deferribacter desulfuricans (strain DSM 14783 / JCM 11476 / NBRC 101012 / SSM1) TaxID=639282 RepID=D3PCE9_DEFDS|nr:hypothetical protein [Deferribacter desulfuricans]BAI80272.1 hypothetical protein DEFDS_0794 [Deferribacter desulfuricans SSM1]
MLKRIIILVFFVLVYSLIYAYDNYESIINEYVEACQSKDLDKIANLIDNSNKSFYQKVLALHKAIFDSMDLKFNNVKVIDKKSYSDIDIVTVVTDIDLKSGKEVFNKKDNYIFVFRKSNVKIIKIINDVNFKLYKKAAIYSYFLKQLFANQDASVEDNSSIKNLKAYNNLVKIDLLATSKDDNILNNNDSSLNFKVSYDGDSMFFGYFIVKMVGNEKEVHKVPLLLKKGMVKNIVIKSQIKPFSSGEYVANVVDSRYNLVSTFKFIIK